VDPWLVIIVTAVVSTMSAALIALLGFWLALGQDKRRWHREKRSELYIDLLAEAYAEEQWIVKELTAYEIREIADPDGTDRVAGDAPRFQVPGAGVKVG
jgi:hypothetical protein